MPRPGPRPYECVRRAWHSERHQPMRGSIIQQIFRVVNDTHSSATKKNKEWQEKLPIVVLKAEEIMYSKANSEAEYLNPDTLWDRLNDAINTIIRRDESTETGDLLPPCVEAALNLGCKPVRASRSERHNNPRTYLTPRTQEPASGSPNTVGGLRPQFPPLQSGNPLNFAKSQAAVSPLPISDSNKRAQQSNRLMMSSCNYPFSDTFPAAPRQPPPLTMETNPSLNLGSVYPLYYGTQYESKEPRLRPTPENTSSDKIFVGTPIITPIPEPAGIGLLQSHSYSRSQQVFHSTAKEPAVEVQEKPQDRECDLSLRLDLSSHPCSSRDKSSACETEDVASVSLRGFQEGNKFSHLSLQMNRDCCFYPRETGFEPFDSNSTRCNNLEDEYHQNLQEATFRKRKAPLGTSNEEDGHFCRQLGVPSNRFSDRSQGPGL
ncbi:KIX domain protein [Senna tora]|uniref:KIX domain protein n=1 Tax=Senna tora TaxID=362788 RepID=A0A834W5B6_9FABA|nr:KIX domain protein [Senna tora]